MEAVLESLRKVEIDRTGLPRPQVAQQLCPLVEGLSHCETVGEWLAVLAEVVPEIELFDFEGFRMMETQTPDPGRDRKDDMDVIVEISLIHKAAERAHKMRIETLQLAEAGEDVGACAAYQ